MAYYNTWPDSLPWKFLIRYFLILPHELLTIYSKRKYNLSPFIIFHTLIQIEPPGAEIQRGSKNHFFLNISTLQNVFLFKTLMVIDIDKSNLGARLQNLSPNRSRFMRKNVKNTIKLRAMIEISPLILRHMLDFEKMWLLTTCNYRGFVYNKNDYTSRYNLTWNTIIRGLGIMRLSDIPLTDKRLFILN